jgi:hypothetical protein
MTFDVVPKLAITAIGIGLAGYVASGLYSQPDASYRQIKPVRQFLEAALAGDSARLSATAEAQPIDWVRNAIRIDSAAVREWAASRPYVSSTRRGDSLWVTLRRFGSTARCSPLYPLTAGFLGQGDSLRLIHLTSSCPSIPRTSLRPNAPPSRKVAVLSIALNDVSNQPVSPELPDRMRWLGTSLRERLGARCGYRVIPVGTTGAAAESRAGYIYGHPDLAAELGGAAGAEWVVVPRLNRASPWVTDLQANVIRVRDTLLVSNRIVEMKGIELSPELAAQLVERGAAWMADQLSQAIEHAAGVPGRRCPP